MDDLDLLADLRADVGVVSSARAVAVTRERLLASLEPASARRTPARGPARELAPARRTPSRGASRRLRVATVAAVAVAAATAVGVAVLGRATEASGPPTPSTQAHLELAAKVLRAAALSAASQPTVRPRAAQWIYSRTTEYEPGSRATTADNWLQFDGRGEAYMAGGKLVVHRAPVPILGRPLPANVAGAALVRYMHEITPLSAYDALASLPPRPGAMLAEIRRAAAADPGAVIPPGGSPSAHTTPHQLEFEFLANLLWNAAQAAPADAEAAAFRALATIPGVSAARGARDAAGRRAISLSDAGVESQLLLDPGTYQVTGLRIVSNGHWPVNPMAASRSPRTLRAGAVVDSLAWLRIAFVARPGER